MSPIPRRYSARLGRILLAWLLAPVVPLTAQDDPRVAELCERVRLLEARLAGYESLAEEHAGEDIEKRIRVLSEAALAGEDVFLARWKNTSVLETEAKDFRVRFGGRIHFDMIWNGQDEATDQAFGHFDDGFLFRRVRLYTDGEIHKNVFFRIQVDFAGAGNVEIRDAYMGVKDVLGGGRVTVGLYKQPFGLDEMTSANDNFFIEKALPSSLFGPSREAGLMYSNVFLENERMTFAISFYRDVDDNGDSAPPLDGDYAGVLRLTGLPIDEDGGETLLHLGIGVGYQNPADGLVRFRQRPETAIGPRLVDTGNISDADDLIRFNFEVAAVLGAFTVQAEYFHVFVSSDARNDPEFWGAYLEVGYFLTGEIRPYSRQSGTFTRVKPRSNLHDGGEGGGAWELNLRYSYADLDDEGVMGGTLGDLSFGVSWYLNPNTKVRLNYTWGHADDFPALAGDEGDVHVVALRFQIDF